MRTLRLRIVRSRALRCWLGYSLTREPACLYRLINVQPTYLPRPRRRCTRAPCSRTRLVQTNCPLPHFKSFIFVCFILSLFLDKCTGVLHCVWRSHPEALIELQPRVPSGCRAAHRLIPHILILTSPSTKSILIPISISLFLSSTKGRPHRFFFLGLLGTPRFWALYLDPDTFDLHQPVYGHTYRTPSPHTHHPHRHRYSYTGPLAYFCFKGFLFSANPQSIHLISTRLRGSSM